MLYKEELNYLNATHKDFVQILAKDSHFGWIFTVLSIRDQELLSADPFTLCESHGTTSDLDHCNALYLHTNLLLMLTLCMTYILFLPGDSCEAVIGRQSMFLRIPGNKHIRNKVTGSGYRQATSQPNILRDGTSCLIASPEPILGQLYIGQVLACVLLGVWCGFQRSCLCSLSLWFDMDHLCTVLPATSFLVQMCLNPTCWKQATEPVVTYI